MAALIKRVEKDRVVPGEVKIFVRPRGSGRQMVVRGYVNEGLLDLADRVKSGVSPQSKAVSGIDPQKKDTSAAKACLGLSQPQFTRT